MRFIKISIIQYIKNNIAKSFSKKRKNLNKLFYKKIYIEYGVNKLNMNKRENL